MRLQRYVSPELTHFAGRGKSEPDQYETLFEILKSGTLRASSGGVREGPVPLPPGARSLNISPTAPLAQMFSTQVVCFCDIPIGDLVFHATKYSPFGLAFTKPFLLARGANPVFYIAETELEKPVSELLAGLFPDVRSRVALFEAALAELQTLFVELEYGSGPLGGPRSGAWVTDDPKGILRVSALRSFIGWYIGCFVKDFDPLKAEDDPDNYYMEREWRVVSDVSFGLDDVTRVFLPKAYFKTFRQDIPDYYGQLHEV